MSVNATEIFLVDNYDVDRPKLSLRVIRKWVALAFSADPLCSTTFRRLIDRLVESSELSSTTDTTMYLFACLLGWKLAHENQPVPYIDDMLKRVMETDPLEHLNSWNRPTHDAALQSLRDIPSPSADSASSSTVTKAFSILRDVLSPFRGIWGDFCSRWIFTGIGNHSLSADSIPLRFISSRTRERLCGSLLCTFLIGKCNVSEVLQIASHDIECLQMIFRLLHTVTTTSDDVANRVVKLRSRLPTTAPSYSLSCLEDLNQWCTGIYRTPSRDKSAGFQVRGGHNHYMPCMSKFDSKVVHSPEILLGHQSFLRWTPISAIGSGIPRENIVRVARDRDRRVTFISGTPDQASSTITVSAVAGDPETWAPSQTTPSHVLTCCSFNGRRPDVYWYNCGTRRLVDAFTLEELETPSWMWSENVSCPVWECGFWWKQIP
ncbi:hypothetical protein JAAARDRAFT_500481 [Jaapia argillacea MUCL 33604]|uniref:Uncharacterized protein n=1 Tax=Jaapia argillacea MUCL 33604 TaxID=933084 RepID=A0A067PA42_9AGAM|nr:hypothetical protein JAAARDRAFT_500481 [Jaapia argillacea MUCL 33604]